MGRAIPLGLAFCFRAEKGKRQDLTLDLPQTLRAAAEKVGNYRLPGSTLYVTLEPCPMCAGAIVHARVERVVFGAPDPRTGAGGTIFNLLQAPELNHRCEITTGVMAEACGDLLRRFFRERRG